MLNPYNISDIENYYLIARNYIHNLRLSSDDNKYIKKQLKKNKTYQQSDIDKKKKLYHDFISWYENKYIQCPSKLLNYNFFNFKDIYSTSINKRIAQSKNLNETLNNVLFKIITDEYYLPIDEEYTDIFKRYPDFKQHLKVYLLSSLYYDLYSVPLSRNTFSINKLSNSSLTSIFIREQNLRENLSKTYLFPYFKLSCKTNDTTQKVLCYNSQNIFDSLSLDILFPIFFVAEQSIYPLDKKYFYVRAHKNTSRKPLEQYNYNDFIDLLKSLQSVLIENQSSINAMPFNTPEIIKRFFNHQIAEFILKANFITYVSAYSPIIRLKNSSKENLVHEFFIDYIIPLIIKLSKIPLPIYRKNLFDMLLRDIIIDIDIFGKNNDAEGFYKKYSIIKMTSIPLINETLDIISSILKESLHAFYREIINNNVKIEQEKMESLFIKEIQRLDYVLFSNYNNYVVPKQWFDIVANFYKDKNLYCYDLLSDKKYIENECIKENSTIEEKFFIEKTANNFSQMFIITNLAYNYGANPASNNEYLNHTIYFLDKRFESTSLLTLFEEFLAETEKNR